MPHLLHIDASVSVEGSTSRELTARAVAAWRSTHPTGTVRYRDLGRDPVPHLDTAGGLGRHIPEAQHTLEQSKSWALSKSLVSEVLAADVVVLGMPLYNYGVPSSVKAWVDHLIAPGLAFDAENAAPLLSDRQLVVIATRGGGYGPGTPKEGWDHASTWLSHGLSRTGLVPTFIEVELTLAQSVPALSALLPMAHESLNRAKQTIDSLWPQRAVA